MLDTLKYLFYNNYKICLLTTKSQEQAELILNHFEIAKYFSVILGRKPEIEIKPSPQPLFYIADRLQLKIDEIIMVGDSEMDVLCGKNAGTLSCAVTYGYRTVEELKLHNPDYMIDDLGELKGIL